MFLGIDTSNYKTSLGLVSKEGEILKDLRKPLEVPYGKKGLRQQEAVFQHLNNLPQLFSEISDLNIKDELLGVTASTRPRPVIDSYMPCFKAGESFGRIVSSLLKIPFLSFSHQEGHLASCYENSSFNKELEFLAFHLSGGTLEILLIRNGITILGGTLDISYGQVLDRLGNLLGMEFPSGEELNSIAEKVEEPSRLLKEIFIKDGMVNLSGFDTQIRRVFENNKDFFESLVLEVFNKIGDSLVGLSAYYSGKYNTNKILMTGGVSESTFLRKYLKNKALNINVTYEFSESHMSSDNGVGVAYLGRRVLWSKSPYPFQT